jgi:hypothetical protein
MKCFMTFNDTVSVDVTSRLLPAASVSELKREVRVVRVLCKIASPFFFCCSTEH